MDFMEGLFLGSLWSDTDFENRRHVSLFMLFGMSVCGVIALSYITGSFSGILGGQRILKMILFLILFLASPFLCFRYYRYMLGLRLLILFVQAGKLVILTLLLTTWVMPYLQISSSDLQARLLTFLNQTLESSTEHFANTAGTFSTVLGVITGGVYLVFLFVSILILAVLVPGTILLLARAVQYGYDKLISKFILGNITDR